MSNIIDVIANESDNISQDIFEEESTPGETVIEENVSFVSNKSQCNSAEFKKTKEKHSKSFSNTAFKYFRKV